MYTYRRQEQLHYKSNVLQLISKAHQGIKFHAFSGTDFFLDFVSVTRRKKWRHVISKFKVTNCLSEPR